MADPSETSTALQAGSSEQASKALKLDLGSLNTPALILMLIGVFGGGGLSLSKSNDVEEKLDAMNLSIIDQGTKLQEATTQFNIQNASQTMTIQNVKGDIADSEKAQSELEARIVSLEKCIRKKLKGCDV